MNLTEELLAFVRKQYDVTPDRPWKRYPENQVLRHKDTGKWFGLIMPVRKEVFGLDGDGYVPVLNVKCDPMMAGGSAYQSGYLSGLPYEPCGLAVPSSGWHGPYGDGSEPS